MPFGCRSRPSLDGSSTGSWSSGTGHLGAVLAVDDRDRGAPVALAGDQPVTQPVGLRGAAGAGLLEQFDDARDRVRLAEPVERTRVDHPSVAARARCRSRPGRAAEISPLVELLGRDDRDGARDGRVRVDDHPHGQAELDREVEVALVVGGHGHDRAVPVVGQHVVGGPDRDPLPVDRVDRRSGRGGRRSSRGSASCRSISVDFCTCSRYSANAACTSGGRLGRQLRRQLGVGRDDHERRAEQRVGARGEDRDGLRMPLDHEVDVGAGRASDPVALHRDAPSTARCPRAGSGRRAAGRRSR